MRTRELNIKLMKNILHETCGSDDIDLQAENDMLRELLNDNKRTLHVANAKVAILNNSLWEYMCWDEKHGPTQSEWDGLEKEIVDFISNKSGITNNQ